MTLSNILYETINKYFNKLSVFGYCSYNEVNKIIAICAIDELLHTYLFTEKQYKLIQRSVNKLLGTSCLLSYPDMPIRHSVISKDNEAFLRISELSNIRLTENNIQRIAE